MRRSALLALFLLFAAVALLFNTGRQDKTLKPSVSVHRADSARLFSQQQMQQSLRISYRYWQRIDPRLAENCTPEQISIDWRGSQTMIEGAAAEAIVGGCSKGEQWINVLQDLRTKKGMTYTPPAICRIIVHEYGHLVGFSHTSDPFNVMYALSYDPANDQNTNGYASVPDTAEKVDAYARCVKVDA